MTSCDDAEVEDVGSPSLLLSATTLAFDAYGEATDGSNGQLTITSNRDWTIEIPSTKDWVSVDVAEGSNSATVTFFVEATDSAREASVSVKLYNDSGFILEESLTITQAGSNGSTDVTGNTATFDGSELSASYPEDATITVDGVDFTVNLVANYSTLYETEGPIQFKKEGSYIYNNTPFGDLKSVVILLAPQGTTYNNFTVFAGSEANPSGTEVTVSKSGDIATYSVPEGTTYVSIHNDSSYAAYAFQIEFLCGDDESTADDYVYEEEEEGGDDSGDVDTTGDVLYSFDFSTICTEATEADATYTNSNVDLVVNNSYYDTSYSNTTIYEGGYIYNTTALSGDIKTIALQYNSTTTSYQTATVYAGTSENPTTELTTKLSDGYYVYYSLPEGSTHFKVTSTSGYVRLYTVQLLGEDDGTGSDDDYTYEAGQLTIDGSSNTDFPTTSSSSDAVVVTSEASFVINNTYLNTYGSISSSTGGYLYNLTAFEGLTQVVVTEDYTHYNYTLCAGSEVNPTTEVSYTKYGNYYIYDIPAGSKYITVINNSTYTAYFDVIDFYFDSLGETADFEVTEPEEEVFEEGVVTYASVLAAMGKTADDVSSSTGLAVEDVVFSNFTFTSDKGTASTAFRLWASDSSIRSYAGNTVTVTASEGSTISSIVFDASEITDATVGSFDGSTWSGSASTVTLTMGKGTNKIITVDCE